MNKVESVVLLCAVQIEQLRDRMRRLAEEIQDCQLQIQYLEMLQEDVASVNVINYLKLDKTFYDGYEDEESGPEEI